jgi:hypothetical protein
VARQRMDVIFTEINPGGSSSLAKHFTSKVMASLHLALSLLGR